MIFSLFKKPQRIPTAVYDQIVEQARSPVFYVNYGVPDTMDGRYEMIALHVALVLRRLRHGPDIMRDFSQDLFDTFMFDMDRSFREMGVGDTTVPKKMKTLGEIFYGRAKSIDQGLGMNEEAGEEDLIAGVYRRNLVGDDDHAARLEEYARSVEGRLNEIDDDTILRGIVVFPPAGAIV